MHDIRDVSREMDRNGMESDMLHVVVEKNIWFHLAKTKICTKTVQNQRCPKPGPLRSLGSQHPSMIEHQKISVRPQILDQIRWFHHVFTVKKKRKSLHSCRLPPFLPWVSRSSAPPQSRSPPRTRYLGPLVWHRPFDSQLQMSPSSEPIALVYSYI